LLAVIGTDRQERGNAAATAHAIAAQQGCAQAITRDSFLMNWGRPDRRRRAVNLIKLTLPKAMKRNADTFHL